MLINNSINLNNSTISTNNYGKTGNLRNSESKVTERNLSQQNAETKSANVDTISFSGSSKANIGIYSKTASSAAKLSGVKAKANNKNYPNLPVRDEWKYAQSKNSYGYTNAKSSCATYALATALSIRDSRTITPDQIETTSKTNGHNPKFSNYGAKTYNASRTEALAHIDQQLASGKPALIHTSGKDASGNNSEHWATVIGKNNGNYTIIDPWDGKQKDLSQMVIYKNGGSIIGYGTV